MFFEDCYKTAPLAIGIMVACLSACSPTSNQTDLPPSHPYLIEDSVYPMIHFDSGQTDRRDADMWMETFSVDPEDISFLPTGIGNIGLAHRTYPNGDQIVFMSGPGRVGKVKLTKKGSLELIDEVLIPGFEKHHVDSAKVGALVEALDSLDADEPVFISTLQKTLRQHDITLQTYANGVYTMMDKEGAYFAGYGTKLFKIADINSNDPNSKIEVIGSRDLRDDMPPELKDKISRFIGMNMTWDGHVVIAMAGVIAVVDRELQSASVAPIPGEFVDNSITVDDRGGIYVVTDQYMRKMVWTGMRLSFDEANGAWKEGYDWVRKPTSLSRGAGTTPTIMGYGEDADRLVIIADQGDPVKAVAFWRDDIPADAKQVIGAPSRRTASAIPLSIPIKSTVEWSPHVSGTGMMMFGSDFLDPVRWDAGFDLVSTCVTSGLTRPAPRGAEKFNWNSDTNTFEPVWSYMGKGLTWSLAPVSEKSNSVHLATIEDGVYSLTGLNWQTGEKMAEITLGKSVKFNTCGAFNVPMPDGSLYLTSVFGGVRIMPPK